MLDTQFSTRSHRGYTETVKDGPFTGEKYLHRNCSDKGPTSDLLDIDFKSGILNMLKGLKDYEKGGGGWGRQMMYEQN